jgi:hypothetical protein
MFQALGSFQFIHRLAQQVSLLTDVQPDVAVSLIQVEESQK